MKNKYVFIGDTNSINVEIICNSQKYLENKVKYIIIGHIKEIQNYLNKVSSNLKIKEIHNPLSFEEIDKSCLNVYNIFKRNESKYKNLIYQIKISNFLSKRTKNDLVTMPINKSIFKKKMQFIGMTEYLGAINKQKTIMLMYGEKFSVVPLSTHINPKKVHLIVKEDYLKTTINYLLNYLKKNSSFLNIQNIIFLCYNPHCGESSTLGNEDNIIKKVLSSFNSILGPKPADSAFLRYKKGTLFISTYHDQVLIPFKILNKKSFNLTLGLDYIRLSPAHGTAVDIKFKNKSDNTSYIECMKF